MNNGKTAKRNKTNLICAFCLVVIVVSFSVAMYTSAEESAELEQRINELAQQSAEAAKYNNELQTRIKYSDEDENIEKIAREKLNMVKPDEILYIDKNK